MSAVDCLNVYFLLFCIAVHSYKLDLIVNTSCGVVQGSIVNDVRSFTSIRYASPPINSLRWSPPTPMTPWNDTIYDATVEPWGCPQKCNDDGLKGLCPTIINEDCLILNIYTPINIINNNTKYAVMIYIHGGVYKEGWSGGIRLNATNLVSFNQNIIVVTLNYRIGALGFLWNPSLNLTGNYGIYDQIFAIKWIYSNIENFGGDTNNMIIFGESAGAHSVAIHLLNKQLTNNIIKGGIMESATLGLPLRSTSNWGQLPFIFSNLCHCIDKQNQLKCLQTIPASLIVENQNKATDIMIELQYKHYMNVDTSYSWSPTVNTTLIPKQPLFMYQQTNNSNDIPPFIIGFNRNEANLFFTNDTEYKYHDLISFLSFMIGEKYVESILNFYNVPFEIKGINYLNYTTQIFTDFAFKCVSRNINSEMSKKNEKWNNNKYYLYQFEYVSSFNKYIFPHNHLCWNNVCHTNEMWYVWNDDYYSFNQSEINLVKQYELYWTNFAKQQNPNLNISPDVIWEPYTNDTQQRTLLINIDDKMRMASAPDKTVCDFWDSLRYDWLNGVNF